MKSPHPTTLIRGSAQDDPAVAHRLRNDDLYRMTSSWFLSRLIRSMGSCYKEKSPGRYQQVQVGSEPLCFFECNRSKKSCNIPRERIYPTYWIEARRFQLGWQL